jgi:4'-phosphopantetheinyl transferase
MRCDRCGHGAHGKPALVGHSIQFSLAHSAELAVIAVAERPIGVDVERIGGELDRRLLVSDVTTKDERTALEALPVRSRVVAFYYLWTAKESIAKGMGLGLSLPFSNLQVGLVRPGDSRQCRETSGVWTVVSFEVAPGYAGAVAVSDSICVVRVHEYGLGLERGRYRERL